tara:strand:- start:5 stop:205 length:201 start_codon:yes stop_codon:yes gene_type:complete
MIFAFPILNLAQLCRQVIDSANPPPDWEGYENEANSGFGVFDNFGFLAHIRLSAFDPKPTLVKPRH